MRYILFGSFAACEAYAKDHDFMHSQWIHGSRREVVTGLGTSMHQAIVVGPTLDEDATAALAYWQQRKSMRL